MLNTDDKVANEEDPILKEATVERYIKQMED